MAQLVLRIVGELGHHSQRIGDLADPSLLVERGRGSVSQSVGYLSRATSCIGKSQRSGMTVTILAGQPAQGVIGQIGMCSIRVRNGLHAYGRCTIGWYTLVGDIADRVRRGLVPGK